MDNGLYWALGIGFEKSNFLVEVLYSVNYSKLKANVDLDGDKLDISTNLSLSTIGINVGYKFNI